MAGVIRTYVRWADRLADWTGYVAMYLIFVMVGVLLLDAVTRNMIDNPLHWCLEFAQFTLAAYYFMGGAKTLKDNDHVRMDLFYDGLSERGRASGGPIGQALRVCQALGSPEAEARQRWGEVDLGWDEAHLPPRLEPGTARPLSLVTFALGVRFEAQRPLALTVGLDAVSLLAPELAPARAEVRRRAR